MSSEPSAQRGDEKCILKDERRQKAKELVRQGIMTGYLLYDGAKIVGWCNAGDKAGYEPLCVNEEFLTDKTEKGRIKVRYCTGLSRKRTCKSCHGKISGRCKRRGVLIC